MLNLTSLFLQQLKTGDLVIKNVTIDVDTNKVTVVCESRTQEFAPQHTVVCDAPHYKKYNEHPQADAPSNRILQSVLSAPDLLPQPPKPLKLDQRTMLQYAELCGGHDNKWHARRSLDKLLRDTRFPTPESMVPEWIRLCGRRGNEIPQEARNLESMFLMEDN